MDELGSQQEMKVHQQAQGRGKQNQKHKEDADVFIAPVRFKHAILPDR
jgi:hypothetical protein